MASKSIIQGCIVDIFAWYIIETVVSYKYSYCFQWLYKYGWLFHAQWSLVHKLNLLFFQHILLVGKEFVCNNTKSGLKCHLIIPNNGPQPSFFIFANWYGLLNLHLGNHQILKTPYWNSHQRPPIITSYLPM